MTHFTPASAALGGTMIGLSASWLLLSLGRIAGISGIVGGLTPSEWRWRLAFLAGLIGTPLVMHFGGFPVRWHAPDAGMSFLIPSGLLVGFGTRLGAGCTSGHGVCGIARMSVRSIGATATFMVTAAMVVYAVRHVWEP
jgi:uncharacterized membrane protein YedE/YeeE